jgi:outer membrane protein assembly factor BamB
MLQGTVRQQNGGGILGVNVSNGREVVTTGADGRYQLPRAVEDRFVFVTVPAGYVSEGPFYRDLTLADATDFVLRPDAASLDADFSFVQITDIHMAVQGRTGRDDLKADLAQIYDEVGQDARFVVATGDLTNVGTREEYDLYLEAAETSRLPIWHGIGNHDDNATMPVENGDVFMAVLGPTYYAFDYGPLHFVMYDAVGQAWRRPDHQNSWLHANLSLEMRPTVFLIHYPLGRAFYDPLKLYPILVTLSGHWHSSRVFQDANVVHYNTPTVCFGGIDESPRGYRLCRYQGGAFTTAFRTLGATGSFWGLGAMPHPDNQLGQVALQADVPMPKPERDWPLLGGTADRRGSATEGPNPPLELAWRAGTGGGILTGSPVVGGGRVFVGIKREDQVEGNALLAFDAGDGTLLWRDEVDAAIKSAPSFAEGRVYAVTITGEVVAVDATNGTRIWTYALGDPSLRWVYMSPLVHEGVVYVGMSPHFAALDARTGEAKWVRQDMGTRDWIGSYPSPAAFGKYLVVAFYGQPINLWVMELATGNTVWNNAEDKTFRINATPVVGPEGTIYAVSGNTRVRAFDLETQAVKWETPLENTRCSSGLALSGGLLFVPTGDGRLYALDAANGEVCWEWTSAEGLASFTPYVRGGKSVVGPPVVAGEWIYVGAADGCVSVLEAKTGKQVWQHNLQIPTLSAPAISGNGLWTCACDGFVYAFSSAQ